VTCAVGYSTSVDVITCTSAGRWDSNPRCSPVGKGCIIALLLNKSEDGVIVIIFMLSITDLHFYIYLHTKYVFFLNIANTVLPV